MAKLTTEELIEQFKELTLIELSEFVKAFEETFDVTAAAPAAVAVAAPPPPARGGGPPRGGGGGGRGGGGRGRHERWSLRRRLRLDAGDRRANRRQAGRPENGRGAVALHAGRHRNPAHGSHAGAPS